MHSYYFDLGIKLSVGENKYLNNLAKRGLQVKILLNEKEKVFIDKKNILRVYINGKNIPFKLDFNHLSFAYGIYITGCLIEEIKPFNKNENLEELKFENCRLSRIKSLDFLKELKILKFLNCNLRNISFVKGLPKLKLLDLEGNKVSHINGLEDLSGLENISIVNNPFVAIDSIDSLPALKQIFGLELSNFYKTPIDFMGTPNSGYNINRKKFQYYGDLEKLWNQVHSFGFDFYWYFKDSRWFFNIDKVFAIVKTFEIDEFITLKLIEDSREKVFEDPPGHPLKTFIFINGKIFLQCARLLWAKKKNETESIESLIPEIDSIDEFAENLLPQLIDLYFHDGTKIEYSPYDEFVGFCSSIQGFIENNCDTRLIHRNLAFPLLKELVDAGHPTAKKVFREEIAKRYNSGYDVVKKYLIKEGYLDYLTEEERLCLLKNN